MLMPGRKYSAGNSYRYGFQGKEKDDEPKGEGNSIDFNFRIYDPRIGRFLSIDPLTEEYPFYSPYHFSSNQPVHARELEGLESEFDLSIPSSPEGVDANHWKLDPTHKAPNGMKWKDVNGNSLYFDKAKLDAKGNPAPGWGGKDHFHFEDVEGNRYNAAGNIAKTKGAGETHLAPGTKTTIKVKASLVTMEVNGLSATTKKTTPTPTTTTKKINGALKSVFIVADIASVVTGLATGNPDAIINQFGNAQVGQLKAGTLDPFEMGFEGPQVREWANYYMITKEVTNEWTENGTKYKTVTRYVQHYEYKKKENGRYTGEGKIGPEYRQTQTYKNGKLIDKGHLASSISLAYIN